MLWINVIVITKSIIDQNVGEQKKEKYVLECQKCGYSKDTALIFWDRDISIDYICYCAEFNIPGKTILLLYEKKVSREELKERIAIIDYYMKCYPYMDLGHGGCVLLTNAELNEYVKKRIKK